MLSPILLNTFVSKPSWNRSTRTSTEYTEQQHGKKCIVKKMGRRREKERILFVGECYYSHYSISLLLFFLHPRREKKGLWYGVRVRRNIVGSKLFTESFYTWSETFFFCSCYVCLSMWICCCTFLFSSFFTSIFFSVYFSISCCRRWYFPHLMRVLCFFCSSVLYVNMEVCFEGVLESK